MSQADDDLRLLREQFGESLVALGRIDAVEVGVGFTILGQRIRSSAVGVSVGDYVAVLGTPAEHGWIESIAVYELKKRYVPGSSAVYLRALIDSGISGTGTSTFGTQVFDLTPSFSAGVPVSWSAVEGDVAEIAGIQPALEGSVLARSLYVIAATSGRNMASTGKTDGSLGSGKTDGLVDIGETG